MIHVIFPNNIIIDNIISYALNDQNQQISLLLLSQNNVIDVRISLTFEEKNNYIKLVLD